MFLHKWKSLLAFCTLMLSAQFMWGQLVTNGSFENFSACPNCNNSAISGTVGGMNIVNNWTENGTPDYFNRCVNPLILGNQNCRNVSIPNNMAGPNINPVSATPGDLQNAYAGLFGRVDHVDTTLDYEYIQQTLSNPLNADQTYSASFYVRLADQATLSTNNIGMLISAASPNITRGKALTDVPELILSSQVGTIWQRICTTFVASGNESVITIGVFADAVTQSNNPQGTLNGAYILIDGVDISPVPASPAFTTNVSCAGGVFTITATATNDSWNLSGRYNLYEMDPVYQNNPCVGDNCMLVNSPIASQNAPVASFTVPYDPDKYYIIKRWSPDSCVAQSETRQLVQIPNLEGSLSGPSVICEGSPIVAIPNGIQPDQENRWTLTVEGIVLGSSTPVNTKTYYGCGTPGPLNLSDPASSGLYNSFFPTCPASFPPNGTPYDFDCDNECASYRIKLNYRVCNIPFSDEFEVHVQCAPQLVVTANPSAACPNQPVTYSVVDNSPANPGTFIWMQGNAQIGTGATLGPIPFDQNAAPIYAFVSNINGCEGHAFANVTLAPGCFVEPGGEGKGKSNRQTQNDASTFRVSNPNQDVIRINYQLNFEGNAQLELVDLQGRVVQKETIDSRQNTLKLPISQLASGLYIMRIRGNRKMIYQEKVIVSP